MPGPKPPKDDPVSRDPIEIAFIEPPSPDEEQIPEQKEYYKLPVRFGAVPVDEAPLGWEVETRRRETKVTKFQHAYPTIRLPFQEVHRYEFGHNDEFLAANEEDPKLKELFPSGANRLFFGDNLHIMRQLPSKSIDLIYIDPPFFSGRTYNVIFGDKNEMRSFTDIWEGGMPGYLIWLNARLFAMKRLLKDTGSIFVHLDWHASHYVKVEMDKIFGSDNFLNEIIWCYKSGGASPKRNFSRKHDALLLYTKTDHHRFNTQTEKSYNRGLKPYRFQGVQEFQDQIGWYTVVGMKDYWEIDMVGRTSSERIGYPTQKPEALIERVIRASSDEGDVVGDFFCGGGTTPAVAQRLNRRWVACDQSRIAVAITADRIAKVVEGKITDLAKVPDFTVEHWGIYEAPKLEVLSQERFREFVVRAFGGRPEDISASIHGVRQGIPLYVGEPSRSSRIGKEDVARFAKAVYDERHANHGVMLAWNFGPDARQAADILAARENKRIDFVRLNLVRLESDDFRDHVISLHKDYGQLLSFIQPPEVRISIKRIAHLAYIFDVSESISLNKDGTIANVQWDFAHKPGKFTSTQGYAFLRDTKSGRPVLVAQYSFKTGGKHTIACSVQDDQGGEKTVVENIEVN